MLRRVALSWSDIPATGPVILQLLSLSLSPLSVSSFLELWLNLTVAGAMSEKVVESPVIYILVAAVLVVCAAAIFLHRLKSKAAKFAVKHGGKVIIGAGAGAAAVLGAGHVAVPGLAAFLGLEDDAGEVAQDQDDSVEAGLIQNANTGYATFQHDSTGADRDYNKEILKENGTKKATIHEVDSDHENSDNASFASDVSGDDDEY